MSQASDYVVWSVVRRQNSKARAYANQKKLPYFTREPGNLIQRQTFKHSGYRKRFVGVGQKRAKKNDKNWQQNEQFTLIMARSGRNRKPRKSVARCVVYSASKPKLLRSIRRNLNMRLYRPELSNLALKRMLKVRDSRKRYKNLLRLQAQNAPSSGSGGQDDTNTDNNTNNEETMVDID